MTDKDSLNKFLHEVVAGKCWHHDDPNDRYGPCPCGKWKHRNPNPDYTDNKNLHLVRELELKAIEEKGQFEWMMCLDAEMRTALERKPREFELITADAETRARAIASLYGFEETTK